ncbi:metal-sensitive transcriptional regulator [Gephyromycinifex aptenodytis]|uniref:metal-sensitive transcriptional regulator n=1 Tax=Gephyromycinifex aptenodytis TaxID=2716227 RepID=UPI0014488333|nr:metal-sensitive transcriptional regulator [Gephyromycinifex aptenodytis]
MVQIDPASTTAVANRLKRAQGQLGGILAMIESGRECEDIVTQLAAVSKAVDRAAFTLIAQGMRQCVQAGDDLDTTKLEKVFLSLA